jgi:exopolysaccharide biosynthesis protein
MRIAGREVLREQTGNPRPFLCFDRDHRARFVAASAGARELQATDHDVIWGRMDAIVDGVVQTEAWRFNQPRTVMGIDRAGERLFLLVVDGRQPRHSVGFTRPQVGAFLQAFSVHDAMLCDEGGSACMYVGAFGGLVTTPSDDQGTERPTYTHFGIVRPR